VDKRHLPELMAEIENWGPSPFASQDAEPLPVYFHNEMSSTTGVTTYSGFGKRTATYLLTTSFRLILYDKRKRGKDRCRSYWHHVDFGEWRWRDKDGFVISGVRTGPIEFKDPTKEIPYIAARWQTYFVSPSGDRKPLEDVTVYLRYYYFHQEQRYAKCDEIVSLPNLEIEGRSRYPAGVLFCLKLRAQTMGTGTLDLDALWLLHTDPLKANQTEVGYIPPDSRLHPDNVLKERESRGYSKIAHSSQRRKRQFARKARKAAKQVLHVGAQARDVIGAAQEATAAVTGGDVAGEAAKRVYRPKFCGRCGAPITPGANFCGRCGMGLTERLLTEAKEELGDKLEEKVIEKVEEILDPGEEPEGSALRASPPQPSEDKLILKPEPDHSSTSEKKAGPARQRGRCPKCNRRVQPTWRFCPDCAQPLREGE